MIHINTKKTVPHKSGSIPCWTIIPIFQILLLNLCKSVSHFCFLFASLREPYRYIEPAEPAMAVIPASVELLSPNYWISYSVSSVSLPAIASLNSPKKICTPKSSLRRGGRVCGEPDLTRKPIHRRRWLFRPPWNF